MAIASDFKVLFLGSSWALASFDDQERRNGGGRSRNGNLGGQRHKDGRIIVTAEGDGTIRWHRADDGRELLALQVLAEQRSDPANRSSVLWTPEGFYEATPGAQDVLKWVVNHGLDRAATTLPASAIAKLHRPDALPLVLQELETAHALGIDRHLAARQLPTDGDR